MRYGEQLNSKMDPAGFSHSDKSPTLLQQHFYNWFAVYSNL